MENETKQTPCPLVVMDAACALLDLDDERRAAELAEALAAVAELVEAGDNADKVLHNIIEAWVPAEHRAAFRSDVASLRAALAKFGDVP